MHAYIQCHVNWSHRTFSCLQYLSQQNSPSTYAKEMPLVSGPRACILLTSAPPRLLRVYCLHPAQSRTWFWVRQLGEEHPDWAPTTCHSKSTLTGEKCYLPCHEQRVGTGMGRFSHNSPDANCCFYHFFFGLN